MLVDALFLAAAGYELALALRWMSMGADPGEDARGQMVVTVGALVAVLLGIGGTVFASGVALPPGSLPAVLVPVSAASYATAHFYAFDSYYLPTLRRYSDGGSISPVWVYSVVVFALIVATLIRIHPRQGLAIAPLVLLACMVTVLAMGVGH